MAKAIEAKSRTAGAAVDATVMPRSLSWMRQRKMMVVAVVDIAENILEDGMADGRADGSGGGGAGGTAAIVDVLRMAEAPLEDILVLLLEMEKLIRAEEKFDRNVLEAVADRRTMVLAYEWAAPAVVGDAAAAVVRG